MGRKSPKRRNQGYNTNTRVQRRDKKPENKNIKKQFCSGTQWTNHRQQEFNESGQMDHSKWG